MRTPTAVALSVPDAADYLGISAITVRRLIARGDLPHARLGRAIRIRLVDLDRYLEERTSTSWSPARRANG